MGSVVLNGATSGATTITPTDGVTATLTLPSTTGTLGLASGSATQSINAQNTFGFKNRIINGGMVIDQRNAGASVTNTVGYTFSVDRFSIYGRTSSIFTAQQNAGAVTPPAGFINYLGITSSAATAVGASDLYAVLTTIEGLNIADLGWGTANAKTITLSFWARSSLTGTFGGALNNSTYARSYPFSYSIPVANTWTQISITIAGDTSGTWLTTNGLGIRLWFGLGVGSTYSGTAGAWASVEYESATGATSVVGTNGATFYITGVQLEVGTQATSFDFRDYGRELILCQRYCYKISTSGGYSSFATTGQFVSTTRVDFPILLPTYMRASPTATYTAANTYLPSSAGTDFTPSAVATAGGSASPQAITVSFTVSGATAGRAATLTDLNTTSSNMIFSAEL